jgi:hypothetical protein
MSKTRKSKAVRRYPKAASTLMATNPNLTAAERGQVQQANRENFMAKLSGEKLTDKLVDIIETEDPDKYSSAEKTLALKLAAGMVYGETSTEGQKNASSAVTINITGLGESKDTPGVTISGSSGEVEDD